jgi:hypothetical protein
VGSAQQFGSRSFRSIEAVEDFLRTEVKTAQLRREIADVEFWQLSADVCSPDHNSVVEQAAMVQSASRRTLLVALHRLNDFLATGAVPDDLKLDSSAKQSEISCRGANSAGSCP